MTTLSDLARVERELRDIEYTRKHADTIAAYIKAQGWRPIATAPKGPSILLCCAGTYVPIYCGQFRSGRMGEPQQDQRAWRCDSSGKFANPTHWMPLPEPPK